MDADDAMKRWTTVSTRTLVDRWWMRLREDHVRLPSGEELEEFHVLEYPEWSCVVCVTDDRRAVMVEQYRYGIDRFSLELPAGVVAPGESAEDCARRELLEETGYEASGWTLLGTCAPDPSRQTNYAHCFLATGGHRVQRQQLDTTEQISVRVYPIEHVQKLARSGRIVHGVHLTAWFWADALGLL
jgi:8-oxo-dGTP pyrophosphatase MutT (NUDIX family)